MSVSTTVLNKIFSDEVNKNFPADLDIAGVILLVLLSRDPVNLYNILYQYKDKVFADNERLIILLSDTDYYPSYTAGGNDLFNLFQIISHVGISTHNIIFISMFPGIEKEIQDLCDIRNLDYPKVIDFFDWLPTFPPDVKTITPVSPNGEKKYLFSCLNGANRTHRSILMAFFYEYNLIDKGLISYLANRNGPSASPTETIQYYPELVNRKDFDNINYPLFRSITPYALINEDLTLCRKSKLLQIKYSKELDIPIKSKEIDGVPNSKESRFQAEFLQQSLIYVVTETVGNYPYPFITEKTWKAMFSCMPFMILGAKNSLKFLKDHGFKTFGDFWDESYDSEDSVYRRCEIIVNNLNQINKQDWNVLLEKIQPIIQHNFDHMATFQSNELEKIRNILL